MSETRELNRGLIDLVDLIPFDVQFALMVDLDISIFEVIDVVTDWMNDAMKAKLQDAGYTEDERYATFDRVILHSRDNKRRLQNEGSTAVEAEELQGVLYTAGIGGYALFTRNSQQPLSVPVGDVLELQRTTLQGDLTELMVALQEEGGLGQDLVDVNTYLNPIGFRPTASSSSSSDDQLQLVIVVAVGVACVAFLFLILAVVWAWRYDRINRQAYLVKGGSRQDPTGSDTTSAEAPTPEKTPAPPLQSIYPQNIYPTRGDGDSLYPDSVITEDINEDIQSSLSAYYRSGLAQTANPYLRKGQMNDAASVSSMESYGYSLDGYAPTIATALPSDVANRDEV
jgi:hypothetical protein